MNGPASSAGRSSEWRLRFRADNHMRHNRRRNRSRLPFVSRTHREIAASAWIANKTMSAMPANPDALAFSPLRDVAPDSIDATGDP